MPSYPEGPPLPEHEHRGLWGRVQGTVRSPSGEPAEGCAVVASPTAPPEHSFPAMAWCSDANGFYRWPLLPPATYTMKANGLTAEGTPLYGEATGVVLVSGHTLIVDIVVTERPDLLAERGEPQP
jgi:hypothetical protein